MESASGIKDQTPCGNSASGAGNDYTPGLASVGHAILPDDTPTLHIMSHVESCIATPVPAPSVLPGPKDKSRASTKFSGTPLSSRPSVVEGPWRGAFPVPSKPQGRTLEKL